MTEKQNKFNWKRERMIILIAFGLIIAYNTIKNYDNIKFAKEVKRWEKIGFQGKTVDGLKQGKWVNHYKNGQIAEINHYKNDALNGKLIAYSPDGNYQAVMNYLMGVKWIRINYIHRVNWHRLSLWIR